jgi:hypothetical protein
MRQRPRFRRRFCASRVLDIDRFNLDAGSV